MATKTYAGKYAGPDEFKGDATLRAAWKAAGSPKDHAKWLKTYKAQKPAAGTPAAGKPAADPAVDGAPASGEQMIIDATGKPVNAAQWQADQARLMAAEQDNEAMAEIEGQEAKYLLDEQGEQLTAAQQRDMRTAAAQRQRKEFAAVKPGQQAKLGNTLSYRGMSRGSAAKRKTLALATEQGRMDSAIDTEESNATKDYSSAVTNAAQRRLAATSALAPRKQQLALRGARSGVYTR